MGRTFFDDGDFEAKLRGADRADIAARPGSDDNKIVGHGIFLRLAGTPENFSLVFGTAVQGVRPKSYLAATITEQIYRLPEPG